MKYIEKKISDIPSPIIDEFLNSYRNQNEIVADSCTEIYSTLPFISKELVIRTSEQIKDLRFQRAFDFRGEPLVVILSLGRNVRDKEDPKGLIFRDLSVEYKGVKALINFEFNSMRSSIVFYKIMEIFDEKKIVSPQISESNNIYANTIVDSTIGNYDWKALELGIKQSPEVSNSLFMIGKDYNSQSNNTVDFSTILYQLLLERQRLNELKELRSIGDIDQIIKQFPDLTLKKLCLRQQNIAHNLVRPSESIFLDGSYNDHIKTESNLYTVENGRLLEEYDTLCQITQQERSLVRRI